MLKQKLDYKYYIYKKLYILYQHNITVIFIKLIVVFI